MLRKDTLCCVLLSSFRSGAPPAAYSNSPTGFSWSDGGPGSAPAAANSTTGVFDSQGLSFSVNVTGCPGPCTVLVFTGAWGANATFTAALGSGRFQRSSMVSLSALGTRHCTAHATLHMPHCTCHTALHLPQFWLRPALLFSSF